MLSHPDAPFRGLIRRCLAVGPWRARPVPRSPEHLRCWCPWFLVSVIWVWVVLGVRAPRIPGLGFVETVFVGRFGASWTGQTC